MMHSTLFACDVSLVFCLNPHSSKKGRRLFPRKWTRRQQTKLQAVLIIGRILPPSASSRWFRSINSYAPVVFTLVKDQKAQQGQLLVPPFSLCSPGTQHAHEPLLPQPSSSRPPPAARPSSRAATATPRAPRTSSRRTETNPQTRYF